MELGELVVMRIRMKMLILSGFNTQLQNAEIMIVESITGRLEKREVLSLFLPMDAIQVFIPSRRILKGGFL
jgi:hypothetical protein